MTLSHSVEIADITYRITFHIFDNASYLKTLFICYTSKVSSLQ